MKFPSPGAERVARALHDSGPATAADLARGLGLSGAVVRRHLDSLIEQGLVSASSKPPFGPTPQRGRGRPARVFALTDRGSHAFDLAYDDLALGALRFLAEAQPDTDRDSRGDKVAQFARQRADVWAQRHREDLDALPGVSERVDALVELLTEEGYAAASVRSDAHAIQICQHHCPISHVAEQFPQLCEAETLAFEQLLGTHVMRLATIAHGDGVCTTLIPVANAAVASTGSAGAQVRGDRVQ